jgi:hypothetical protein
MRARRGPRREPAGAGGSEYVAWVFDANDPVQREQKGDLGRTLAPTVMRGMPLNKAPHASALAQEQSETTPVGLRI